ncbi:hypothetical protein RchiOBHm_Chr2g0097231 [Rosa chinensis]|uniref:Uncharacterized protein n=1 Tax=Rosa chinensis TaxID=74649 RepID=A0A2P6RLD3_ROSCH|nr:hypothetical protein RchiOBHm_Chr2g0097231 [Rosa chinensis]
MPLYVAVNVYLAPINSSSSRNTGKGRETCLQTKDSGRRETCRQGMATTRRKLERLTWVCWRERERRRIKKELMCTGVFS